MQGWMRMWVGVIAFTLLMSGAGAARAEDPTDGRRVVARVNKVDVTYDDFQVRLRMLEQERGPISPDRYGEILHALVREEILYQAAKAQGLDDDAAVKQRAAVAARQVVIEELLRRKVNASSQVTDAEARKAYDENKPLFTTESVGVSHIMVKSEAEAEAIQAELKNGASFADLAKRKSQDTGSAEKGGDLGTLNRGQADPDFEAAAFALKDGDVSSIVKTQYGYHILKGGAHSTTVQPFDEVKGKLTEMLGKQKQRDALMQTMAELEKQATSETFEDRLK